MTPDQLVLAAIRVAEEGLEAGELPIGAVVALGDDIVASAFTQERRQGRRLVHADLLAMEQADRALGRGRRGGLRLAVNLEPCLMCIGAAMSLGVEEVLFALEAPADGAAAIAAAWGPASPSTWYRPPTLTGGIRHRESRELFRRYAAGAGESALRAFAAELAALPD
ncbi:MAG TPA: deaminase [Candidatus Dormibacteraeota bacterium]|nr:deaminase [Candidatus Dormibacteraeota bacterium]